MGFNLSNSPQRLIGTTGLLTLSAALAGLCMLAIGMFNQEIELYAAEAIIVALLIAMALRELGAWLYGRRQTSELHEKMREIEEKNRLLTMTEASAHVGHWQIDLTTNAVFWSRETFLIHGLEPGELPSLEKAIDYYHPDDRPLVSHAIESSRRTGDPYTFRARLVRADGELRHTEASAQVEFNEYGEPIAMFGVFRDRTDEEAMQQQLREARDEARELAEAKSGFLAKMSHEIRTPMNGVLGFAELLQASQLDQTQRRHVDLISESGRILQTLLNDILDLTKIEAGHMQVNPEPTDLGHLIQRVSQLVEPMAREKALKIERVVDTALPPMVLIDGLRLRQILTNLMHNAIRFTNRGQIRLSAVCYGGQLEIVVADTGIGIAETKHEAIFQAFAQADGSTAAEQSGTGLGLAICRQLAELMEGTLTVSSIPGTGSAFTLTVPLIETSEIRPCVNDTRTINKVERLSARRILLAEDFDINRELIGDMASRIGVALEMAEDGEEAVDMVREASTSSRPYELVLMDMRMPNMDGLEAAQTLRASGFGPAALPIIALTANAFADDVEACLDAGMQEHLSKPVSVEALRDALERWLPQQRKTAA